MKINGIDQVDNKIVNLLLENGRMSYSEIGQALNISRTTVKNRISFLEEQNIISGYKAIVNPLKSKNSLSYLINLDTKIEFFDDIKNKLSNFDNVVSIFHTTGKCKLILICVAYSQDEVSRFLDIIKKEIKGIVYAEYNAIIDVIKG